MNVLLTLTLCIFVAIGGFWGWRNGTIALRRSPQRYEAPMGMSQREYVRLAGTRLRRRRILLAAGGGALGAAIGFGLLLALALGMRR